VKIWGLKEAKVIRSIDHPNNITVIKFTHDSQYVITGGEDNSCKIWELLTGKLIQVLIEHDGAVTSIDVPFNNNLIVSGAKDRFIILWNFKDGSVIHKLAGHHDLIVKVAITFDGNIIISGSREGVINVWSSRYGNLLTSINLQFTLVELIVSMDATSIVARLAESTNLPIISLTHKNMIDCNRATSQASLKSFEYISKSQNGHLPLKPKPLVFAKKSTELLKLFTQEAVEMEKKARRQSEITSHIQAEPISVTQHSSRGIFQKQKRKTKKSSEFSSNIS
ncbi:NACHT and WD repeat domain-containing 1, partial [Brachionus plicatilis]